MDYEITIRKVGSGPVAVVRRHVKLAELPRQMLSWYDIVYVSIRSGTLCDGRPDGLDRNGRRLGQNVAVYRNFSNGEVDVECGVQLEHPLEPDGEVICTATPAGKAAVLAYYGDYSGITSAHSALQRWCQKNGCEPAGVRWEVYGDWQDDPKQLRTDLFHLLR